MSPNRVLSFSTYENEFIVRYLLNYTNILEIDCCPFSCNILQWRESEFRCGLNPSHLRNIVLKWDLKFMPFIVVNNRVIPLKGSSVVPDISYSFIPFLWMIEIYVEQCVLIIRTLIYSNLEFEFQNSLISIKVSEIKSRINLDLAITAGP